MKKTNFVKLYLLMISLVSFGGALVGLGITGYTLLERVVFPLEESIANHWKFKDCEIEKEYAEAIKTDEECLKIKENLILEKNRDYKEVLFTSIFWGGLFLLVFLVHFPIFLRMGKKD